MNFKFRQFTPGLRETVSARTLVKGNYAPKRRNQKQKQNIFYDWSNFFILEPKKGRLFQFYFTRMENWTHHENSPI